MRGLAAVFLFGIFLVLACQSAFACVCYYEPRKLEPAEVNAAIEKEFNESASVFAGEVIALDLLNVRFRIITIWKGDNLDEFVMSTGTSKFAADLYQSSSCDYNFKIGEKYLVYARYGEDNQLRAVECSGTKFFSLAATDIPVLNALSPGKYDAPINASNLEVNAPWLWRGP